MRAVLFDLDGTLLDIDVEAFLCAYFGALGPVLARLTNTDEESAVQAVIDATDAMMRPHPGRTNRDVFDVRFRQITGVDLERDGSIVDEFYRRIFPGLGTGLGPTRGARAAVEAATGAGMLVAVATNPIFPAAAVAERIRWAGLDDLPFALVTTYEQMHACKPDPAYFAETASILEVEPADCLMVGDDAALDMGAASVGMSTFFVGEQGVEGADYSGSLFDLARLMPRLADRRTRKV